MLRAPFLRPRRRPGFAAGGLLAVGLASLGLSGCASYPDRLSGAVHRFEQGDNAAALTAFSDRGKVKSRFLLGAEAGTVAFAALDWPSARSHFEGAVEAVRAHEDQSLVGEGALESAGTLLFNETAADYVGEGYERVLVHSFLALCYLAQGDTDGLGVEVRRANQLLEREEALYEKKYAAGGLGHFISATAYLLRGDLDDALIDYRRMLDKGVGLELARPEAARLVRALGREDEFPELLASAEPAPSLGAPGDDRAWIVVVAGVGLAPYKVEQLIAFPTPAGVVSLASPVYIERPQPVLALRLSLPESNASFDLSVIEDVARTATENLSDRLGALAVKSALRNVARLALRNNIDGGKNGAWAALAVDIFSLAAERADLRSWLTLPKSFQALRLAVPPGEHEFRLEALGGQSIDLGHRFLEPGETVFVVGRNVGRTLNAALIGGSPVLSGLEAPTPPFPVQEFFDSLPPGSGADFSSDPPEFAPGISPDPDLGGSQP